MIARLLLLIALLVPGPILAETRVALVIGNSAYQNVGRLDNPANDARDIGAALEQAGFEVDYAFDLTLSATLDVLKTFRAKSAGADAAVLYYAGHGIEVDRKNFMIPIDAALGASTDVEFETVPLEMTTAAVAGARRMSLVIMDACRNNPFLSQMRQTGAKRNIGRGLGAVEPAGNTLVAYAAREGTLAADGDGRNSPYAAAWIRALNTPGVEIGQVFRQIRDEVLTATGGVQQPFVYGSLSAKSWYFRAPDTAPPATEKDETPTTGGEGKKRWVEIELAFWQSVEKVGTAKAYQTYLESYPNGAFAPLAQLRIAALEKTREGGVGETTDRTTDAPTETAALGAPREIFRRRRPVHIGDERIRSWAAPRPVGRCYNIAVGAAPGAKAFRIAFDPFGVDDAVVVLAGERRLFSQTPRAGKKRPNYWGRRVDMVLPMRRDVRADDRIRICARLLHTPGDPDDRDDFMVRGVVVTALPSVP